MATYINKTTGAAVNPSNPLTERMYERNPTVPLDCFEDGGGTRYTVLTNELWRGYRKITAEKRRPEAV